MAIKICNNIPYAFVNVDIIYKNIVQNFSEIINIDVIRNDHFKETFVYAAVFNMNIILK